jgi:hypothetical protein
MTGASCWRRQKLKDNAFGSLRFSKGQSGLNRLISLLDPDRAAASSRPAVLTALPNQSLHLVFQDGFEADVGLGDWIANTSALQALMDPALFSRARVGEWGSAVEWIADELNLGAHNLHNLAVEQAGASAMKESGSGCTTAA